MITLEKKCKFFFFCGKKQGPNQWFCSDKKSKQNKKNSKKKKEKNLAAYLCRYCLQNGVWKFI